MSVLDVAQEAVSADAETALAVSAANVDVRFGSGDTAVAALKGVSVDIPDGAFVTMLGPSDCGKVHPAARNC